jgi:hypothetical protein
MIPPRHYTIESGGQRELFLTWDAMTWKNFVISVDRREIARVADGARELRNGREFKLPGGATLKIQVKGNLFFKDLHVFVNNEPIPNSPSDPDVKIRRAANALYFMAAFDFILGLIAAQSNNPALTSLCFGWTTVAIGMLLFSLALLVRKGSLIALFLAIGLYIIDTILGYYVTTLAGIEPEIGIIVARLFLLASMLPAVQVILQTQKST